MAAAAWLGGLILRALDSLCWAIVSSLLIAGFLVAFVWGFFC
jgi:hypothetical protein